MFKTRGVDALELGCRLHHHRPTSYEVGMRENLTRTPTLLLSFGQMSAP